MFEIRDNQIFYLRRTGEFEDRGIHFVMDSEGPHWIATDSRGASIVSMIDRGLTVGRIISRHAEAQGLDGPKAWLQVQSFLRAALRAQFISDAPIKREPYTGRAAYLRPERLRELWLHTNNSCNLACTHCLVSSSPSGDRGLSTDRLKDIVGQAVDCGVERFYFTGGEPFARRDIFELIDLITKRMNRELIILTNATLFHGARLEKLAQFSRELLRLQISLDGSSPATNDRLRGGGTFAQIRTGTRNVTRLGFRVSLTTVVTREN